MTAMRTSLQPPPPPVDDTASSRSACSTCGGAAQAPAPAPAPARPTPWVGHHQKELKAALAAQKQLLMAKKAELTINDDTTKANLKKFFGSDSESTRQEILARVDREITLTNVIAQNPAAHFRDGSGEDYDPDGYAYVIPEDKTHKIYINPKFHSAKLTGEDSRAGTLGHEMSHFEDIAGTDDKMYGREDSLQLAKDKPEDAMLNADSFEYYLEGSP